MNTLINNKRLIDNVNISNPSNLIMKHGSIVTKDKDYF